MNQYLVALRDNVLTLPHIFAAKRLLNNKAIMIDDCRLFKVTKEKWIETVQEAIKIKEKRQKDKQLKLQINSQSA